MGEIVSFHAVVRGQVQGVGFRYFARQRAEAHGVCGFVRNLPDGTVELHAEGLREALSAFEADIRRGPSFGRVDEALVTSVKARGYQAFEIR
ncbi:MAG: acylphosphatase [Vicinamibacteria bacterium]|nr:acylphosphatase [Vicinamibacteria bacterium]